MLLSGSNKLKVVSLSVSFTLAHFLPRINKSEKKAQEEAGRKKIVQLSPYFLRNTVILNLILSAFAIAVLLFPEICYEFGFDPTFVLFFFWIPILICDVTLCLICDQIKYGEETFSYRNAFFLKTEFRYEEIKQIVDHGHNKMIITNTRKIPLRMQYAGAQTFLTFLHQKCEERFITGI